jgi:uncharacterized cupredoxin-like copper-binding protein
MQGTRTRSSRLALGLLALILVACTPAASATQSVTGVATSSALAGATVDVTLKEFAITVSGPASHGAITFRVKNSGTMMHEFDIYKSSLALDKLPVNSSQQVDEGSPDVETIEASEPIPAGSTAEITATLKAGHYYLVCNQPGHYALGMRLDYIVR